MKNPAPKLQPSAKAWRQSRLPSASQTRPPKDTSRTGVMSTGGSAAAASAPSRNAQRYRRQPDNARTCSARRCNGIKASPPRSRTGAASATLIRPYPVRIGNAEPGEDLGLERLGARGLGFAAFVIEAQEMQHAVAHQMRRVLGQALALGMRFARLRLIGHQS